MLQEAARLTWKMVIQKPPMIFECPCIDHLWTDVDTTCHEPFYGSDLSAEGALIKYYIFPILRHGNKCMVTGKVYVK